ncbi:hypothetical protein N0V94_008497 [Neodidymelliopsis sp. IMI 364377]|nr:hypothetical protein N0V94_008497 [Neodidymelliopsis sp. IMI 364377]
MARIILCAMLAFCVNTVHSAWPIHELAHCRYHPEKYATIDTYTPTWFLANVSPDVIRRHTGKSTYSPGTGAIFTNALFYTQGMSELAQRYACLDHAITIWEPWPAQLYNASTHPTNPYSCIHHCAATRTQFYENMSEAFAMLAKDEVLVMHSRFDYFNPPRTGIWHRVERKTLIGRKEIKTIYKQSEMNRDSLRVVWNQIYGLIQDSASWVAEEIRKKSARFGELRVKSHLRRRAVGSQALLASGADGEDRGIEGDGEDGKVKGDDQEDEVPWVCKNPVVYTLHVDW